ncbi:hypothetical protein FRC12_015611 [Ceratobasidium sp. 428]|nr:hypothetical protein FRC12_015611 [Ceratobasidium sp. 428]
MSGVPVDRPSPVHRVLACPELFRLICDAYSLDYYPLHLIRLSRRIFPVAASVIWEDVGVQRLLALIPGTKRTEQTRDHVLGSICVFDFPSTEINLERFELYAPFVRRLYTWDPCAINFPPHWMQPKQGSVAAPLLPNLLHLEIDYRAYFRREELGWSSMFIGPSLLRFEARRLSFDEQPQARDNIILELVTKMSEVCPRLETLSVPSRKDLSLPILDFHNLRDFSINEYGINDELIHALSRLPYLEELSVSGETVNQSQETNKEPIKLSDDSFPSLQRLFLNHISPFLITRFCTSTELFRKLTAASIFFGSFDKDNVSMDNLKCLNIAVFSLGRNSPHITDLAISFDGWFVPSWSIIDLFKHMPLRSLDLCLAPFDSEYTTAHQTEQELPPIGWHDFLAAVPLLEELKLNAQMFKLSGLPIFATTLPHLRLLELGIDLNGTEEVPTIVDWHPATRAITVRVNKYMISTIRVPFASIAANTARSVTLSSLLSSIIDIYLDIFVTSGQT